MFFRYISTLLFSFHRPPSLLYWAQNSTLALLRAAPMPTLPLRELHSTDYPEWWRMRHTLWPDCPEERHLLEMHGLRRGSDESTVFVVDRGDGALGGFIEVSVRATVDGAHSARTAYVEGWYVDPNLRGQGVGRQLMEAAEAWAVARGHTEIASDAEIDNLDSIQAHQALGFSETFRVVQFIKRIVAQSSA